MSMKKYVVFYHEDGEEVQYKKVTGTTEDKAKTKAMREAEREYMSEHNCSRETAQDSLYFDYMVNENLDVIYWTLEAE